MHGDTIFIDLPGQHPLFGQRMGLRIFGIDTPEIRTKNSCEKSKGQLAKKLLDNAISHAKRVDIVDVLKDKFFRILGTVLVDGKPVIPNPSLLTSLLSLKSFLVSSYHRNFVSCESMIARIEVLEGAPLSFFLP